MGTRSRPDCPSEDALLRWSTGDLLARRGLRVQRHVATCAVCDARLRGWEAAMATYRAHDAHAVPAGEDTTAARTQFEARLRREPRTASAWMPAPHLRWLHAAAALLLATTCILWLRPAQATLSAEALIARAVDSEQQAPLREAASRVTITSTPAKPASAAAAGAGAGARAASLANANHAAASSPARRALPLPASDSVASDSARTARAFVSERGPDARELARRLEAYQFDWQFPLSAKPFQHWRASTPARADSLEWVDATLVRVSTRAEAGHVRRAELMLHAPDFRPVAQIWHFADGFEVELRMLDRATPSSSPFGPPAKAALDERAADSAAAAAPRSLDEVEIDLRGALERFGIVLDRRVTIRRAGDIVVIDGRAPSAAARRIAAAARDLPNVDVRVRAGAGAGRIAPAPAPAPATSTTAAPSTADATTNAGAGADVAPSPGLRQWLDRTFAASPLHDTFMPRARELDARLEDAVAALDDLARHYPAPVVARLPPASRQALQRLAGAYFRRVTDSYERLEAHLAPLTGTVSRRVLPADAPATWRATPSALDADLQRLSADLATLATAPYASAEEVDTAARDRLRPALAAVAPR
jgi:hypothetical protein